MEKWDHDVKPGRGVATFGEEERANVSFHANYPALHFYVLIRGKPGPGYMLAEMEPTGCNQWCLTVALPAGTYWYRYYANHGNVTTYVSPAEVGGAPVNMRRFDAVVEVEPRGGDILREREWRAERNRLWTPK